MTGPARAPVRVGVLGCSAIAWRRTLPALAAGAGTVVQAVASRDPDKAARFASRFDCAATTYDGLLKRDDIDAVYLPLPPALHEPWGTRVLEAGMHLLLEKPAATCASEASRLVALAAASGLVLRENFTFLRHPLHARVRALVDSGRIGELRSMYAAFCFPPLPATDIRYDPTLGGGALLDAGVYPVRLAQLLLGPVRVAGASLRGSPVDRSGSALLVAGSGVTASLEFGFEHAYGSRYTLWGSRARLTVDRAFTPAATWQPVLHIEEQDREERLVLPAADQFAGSVDSFAGAILEGRTAADPSEGCAELVRTMELVDAIRAAGC